ncbi:hypothetical protein KCP78_15375 [Salmonella enterica subsp. enterica]|nr:hypothetical protein KCP78_15375 [Salmonella enterica subsp. enterica]
MNDYSDSICTMIFCILVAHYFGSPWRWTTSFAYRNAFCRRPITIEPDNDQMRS